MYKKNHPLLSGLLVAVSLSLIMMSCNTRTSQTASPVFTVTLSKGLTDTMQDGRLMLLLSDNSEAEPRYQISDGPETQLAFGMNVEGWEPAQQTKIDLDTYGYPIKSVKDIPEGDYYVQAVLNRYDSYQLSDDRVLKLPTVKRSGQQWNRKPGNFYSKPQKVTIGSGKQSFSITLDEENPPRKPFEDTEYVKHVSIRSEKLSKFWGRDVYLGAYILLPKGFSDHPDAHYPLMISHGHFPSGFSFRTEPPEEADSNNKKRSEYTVKRQESAYKFYKTWTGDNFPRYLVIKIEHTTPYYDDSYAVNSANVGPYGDAITYELIPYIEQQFRGIGKEWSRYLYGGSTGGWEALAAQVFYPEEYGGTFAGCPDGVDFRGYQILDIYNKDNAYYLKSGFKKTRRPGARDALGRISSTMEDQNHRELALGTKSRSGQQWDVWEATYSPVGPDGYPARIWDKETGKIDHDVAAYWKENYDLRYILERDWEKGLGKKLKGKIHIYVGDMDTYYLNNAVYYMEDFLESTKDPYYDGEVVYGDRQIHCWTGPSEDGYTNYNTKYLPKILKLMKQQAPPGADLTSWRY